MERSNPALDFIINVNRRLEQNGGIRPKMVLPARNEKKIQDIIYQDFLKRNNIDEATVEYILKARATK